ncbi:hypothetical protein CYY_004317 [Polysphondylium violaceum]|uniref:Intimal thickness related receptor IRP domain-containing protein n=1 Tax=Polysphondylium violaceum TaxID=133409 RepID=A0A8J4V0F2_9MYCE|nr:hypothetical protein CYY_004317 [Polysphondylium violaceum]
MMISKINLISLILLVICVWYSHGLTIKGRVDADENWFYLEKFCFENGGQIKLSIDWGVNPGDKALLLYSDRAGNWGGIKKNESLSCSEKKLYASYTFYNNFNQDIVYNITQQRNRWWYFVFVNCQESSISIPSFEIKMTNNGDRFDREISADQQSIPQAQVFFILFFSILLAACITSVVLLSKRGLETKIVKQLIGVISLKVFGLLLFLVNWGHIIKFGYELRYLAYFGNLVSIVSSTLFIMLLLLVSQGYTISIYYGSLINKAATAVIVVGFTAGCWGIFTLVYYYYSSSSNTYIFYYDTIPGYVLLAIYLVIGLFFGVCCFRTHRKQNDMSKRRFFIMFACVFICWFVSLPVVVIVAHFMDPWVRYKVITILNLIIDAIFFVALTIIFRPTKTNLLVQILNKDEKLGENSMKMKELD